MNSIISYFSNSHVVGVGAVPSSVLNSPLARTQLVFGNLTSVRIRDMIPGNSDSATVLDLCSESIRVCKPVNFNSLEKTDLKKADPQEQRRIFAQRFFAYYMAKMLSGSKHPIEEYVKFANQVSNDHTKDTWASFKNSSLWKDLATTEKVKATAAYYLFGDIAKNFLKDLLDNFMGFFKEKYSSKKDLESLFIRVLEKMNRFLANSANSAEEYITTASKKTSFEERLAKDLINEKFIRSLIDVKEKGDLTEKNLFMQLGELCVQHFLPHLRIKDAVLNKLHWNFNGNLEKALWAIPYIAFVTLHIPLLIVACAFEVYINDSIKDTLTEKLPSFADTIATELKNAWDGPLKDAIITSIYTQLEKPTEGDSEPVSSADLNPEIREQIKTLIPIFFKSAHLYGKNGNREEMEKALDPQYQTLIGEQVQSSLESFAQEAFSSLFTGLIKDDLVENILHAIFENLTGSLTKGKPAAQAKKTKKELLDKIEEIVKPTVRANIEDMIGSETSVGLPTIEKFFDRYKRKFTPHLQRILNVLQNAQNMDEFTVAVDLLDQHRNAMNREMQKFKELFEVKYPHAFRQVNEKLLPIAKAQNRALEELVSLLDSQKSPNRGSEKTQLVLQNLLEMHEKTVNLKADPIIIIRPTQVVSTAISAIASSFFPISIPAIALGSALIGSSDPFYSNIKDPLFDRIYPKIQETVSSSMNFFLHDSIFPRITQTLAVIAKDELSEI